MKKLTLFFFALLAVCLAFQACDNSKTYAEMLEEEKDAISKLYPDAHIVRTMRQKSKRHRYYCEESTGVMKYLEQTRAVYGTPGQKDGAGIGHFKKKQ